MDYDGYKRIMESALRTQELIEYNEWEKATAQWSDTEVIVLKETANVDFYNIAKNQRSADKLRWRPFQEVKQTEPGKTHHRSGLFFHHYSRVELF